jgi:hypothetical protein
MHAGARHDSGKKRERHAQIGDASRYALRFNGIWKILSAYPASRWLCA